MGSAFEQGDGRGLALRITRAFMAGAFDLSRRSSPPSPGWDGMPEVLVTQRLRAAGTGDAEIRLFITFTAAMDRARDADRLWNASARLFQDRHWPYLPEEVVRQSTERLMADLRSYGVSQRHTVDAGGWHKIAQSLGNPRLSGSVRAAIYDGKGDAKDLLKTLRAVDAGDPRFPLLRGPKIGVMWVRMLAYPGGACISSLGELDVAVDVQVRKVSEYLGVTRTRGQDLERVRTLIQRVWAEDVRRHGAEGPGPLANTPAAVDPALWFYGKWGCTKCEQARRKIPISDICRECRFDELHDVNRVGG
ncbi:MAG TPA: hypothetical protein VFF86_04740 [Candidatus Methylomirabilis sp.]|nr:hypothetical protein [Candidatus Methylomirabilis sp.]